MLRLAVLLSVASAPFGMRFMIGEGDLHIVDAMAFSATILVIIGLWISTFVEKRFTNAVDTLWLDAVMNNSNKDEPLSNRLYFLLQLVCGLYFALLGGFYFVWWYHTHYENLGDEARFYIYFVSLLSFLVGSRFGVVILYGWAVAGLARRQKALELVISHPDGYGGLGPVAAQLRMHAILVGTCLLWISIWLLLLYADWPKGLAEDFPDWRVLLGIELCSLMPILWFGVIHPVQEFARLIEPAKERLVKQVITLSSAANLKAQRDDVKNLDDFLSVNQAASERSNQLRAIHAIPEVPIAWTKTGLIEVVFGVPIFVAVVHLTIQAIVGKASLREFIGCVSG